MLTLKDIYEGLKDTTYKVYNNEDAIKFMEMAYQAGLDAGMAEHMSGHSVPNTLEEYLGV